MLWDHGEQNMERNIVEEEKKMNLGCFNWWQKFISFFLIFGDISIFMQPKCFRFCDGWKLLDELNVICILAIRGCIVYSWCRELVIIVQDIRGVENRQNAQQRFAVMTICHSSTIIALPSTIKQCLDQRQKFTCHSSFFFCIPSLNPSSLDGEPISTESSHSKNTQLRCLCISVIELKNIEEGKKICSMVYFEGYAVGELIKKGLELPETDLQIWITELVWYVPSQWPILDALLHGCMEKG